MQAFSWSSRPVLFFALATALLAAGCQQRQAYPGDENDNELINAAGSCGVERWAVKTGTDSAASQVNMTAQDTTIVNLRSQPVPAGLGSGSSRFVGTAETQLYRLTGVTLTQYKLESDSDYHLVLSDGSGNTMIAEIPAPSCVSGGPWASSISAARAAMDAKFTVTGSFQSANIPVTITGVGFFDLLHGQTGVAPNGIELHAILSVCFPGSSVSGCSASTPDFSLGASPTSLSTAQGATGTSTITVTGSGGFSGSVSLSATGLPAGASSSFSPASVASGGSSTLSLNAGTAAAGTYSVTVTGTSGTISHTAAISWTITGGGGGGGGSVTNGGFETGSLSGWTSAGSTSVVSTGAHGGTYAAQVGSASPGTDSSISQSVTLPAGSPSLSFWYKNVCTDTVTYDWATVTVAGSSTITALAKTCVNDGVWHQVTTSLASLAGQTVTLRFANHDDNNAGDPTYTLYDDVALSGGTAAPDFALAASPSAVSTAQGASGSSTISITAQNGFTGAVALTAAGVPSGASASFSPTSVTGSGSSALTLSSGTAAAGSYTVTVTGASGSLSHSATIAWTITSSGGGNAITNGNFEAGTLTGWTVTSAASISTTAHSGTYAAQVGTTTTAGLASIAQTFTVPSGGGPLSFWYRGVCADTVTYAWAIATLKDNTTNTTTTLLPKTCTNTGAWVQVTSAALTAGHSMTLTLSSQGENLAGYSNYTLYDDVNLAGGAPSPDFALSASPASVSTAQGASGSSTISITAQNGFAGSVALSAAGLPSGASASFSPASVAGSGSSAATLSSGTAAAGSYTVTVTGVSGSLSHSATIAWTITAAGGGGGVTNGGFETGSLSGWTTAGQASVVSSGAHGGTYAAQVGSASPGTDSSISQSVTLPTGSPSLTFWYKNVCTDTVTYDWATVTVAGTTTVTALAKTCVNDGVWHQVTTSLAALAGQTVTLSFANHDDNNAADPTYTLYDDVAISGAAATPDFALSLSSGSVNSAGAASATDTVTVTPSGGFTAAVALSASGVPAGATASFSPASVAGGSGSSTVTLSPGTAAAGTYQVTITGTGGGLTHTAALSWTLSVGAAGIQTVFLILMENHNWSSISGSTSAPYINNTLLPQASYALNYQNVPGLHPSLPNYLWLEAGTNFGITADGNPSTYHQSTTSHLVTLLQNAGVSWRAYQEDISGTTCPLTPTGQYAPKHLPMIYFDDVTNTNNTASANCIAHVKPYTQLATDLTNNTAARYNFITPNLCDDMHGATGCPSNTIQAGDTWLSQQIPVIMNSAAYRNNGAIFITWDESEGSNVPIGFIVLSPKGKGAGYTNNIAYSHSSTLRSLELIFGVSPMLGGAATATDLSDLFTSFP